MAKPGTHPVGDGPDHLTPHLAIDHVPAEGPLCTDGSGRPIGADRARVPVTCEGVEMRRRRPPDPAGERRLRRRRQIADGVDAERFELGPRRRSHAPEYVDRQRVQKGDLVPEWHFDAPVGLGHP